MNLDKCDLSQSLVDYIGNEYKYEKGCCYNNAFKVMTSHRKDKSLRGVIGYVLSSDGVKKIAVRHSWVKLVDRYTHYPQIIDVTMFANGYNPVSVLGFDYLTVKEFTPTEWLRATEQNNNIPCIENLEGEEEIIQDLESQGYEILDKSLAVN